MNTTTKTSPKLRRKDVGGGITSGYETLDGHFWIVDQFNGICVWVLRERGDDGRYIEIRRGRTMQEMVDELADLL